MKKFISLMICVAMILSSVGAMADSDSLIVNTVKVNVSSGSVTLNDEGMSVSAAPYVNQNGDTMVDMYALVNALGGEITEKDGVYSVTYARLRILFRLIQMLLNSLKKALNWVFLFLRIHYILC